MIRLAALAFAAAILAPVDAPAAIEPLRAMPLADTTAVIALVLAAADMAAAALFPTR